MNLKKIISSVVFSIASVTSFSASAISLGSLGAYESELQSLSLRDCLNGNLEAGSYAFGDFNRSNKGFSDNWTFSMAEAGDVTISLFDFVLPPELQSILQRMGGHGKHHGKKSHAMNQSMPFSPFLDNSFLTASLFDENGNLLSTIGENGIMTLTGLQANSWYTLAVSGTAVGKFGGLYYGSVEMTAVPLGDTLPLFGSALIVLAVARRRSAASKADLASSIRS